MALPLALMPIPRTQWFDANGDPLTGGVLRFYVVGTSTPKKVYTTSDGGTDQGTTVTLDSDGRAAAIYLGTGGYKVTLEDSTGTLLWTQDEVESAESQLSELGVMLSDGARAVTSGYQVLDTDQLVTVASSGGPSPCIINLPAAAERGLPLTIKNRGTVALSVVPDGTDTIEGEAWGSLTVPAAVSPNFPTVTLMSDGTGWWITSSHGVGTLV